jgi:polygalacturonase
MAAASGADAGGDADAAAAVQAVAAAVAAQGCFQVLLPPTQLCSSGYVLLQSRFQASLASSWQVGDRVQVSSCSN